MSRETDFVQFLNHVRDADDPVAEGDRGHAAAEDFSAFGLHSGRHVFPVHVFDFGAEFSDVGDGISAAEPKVSGVEVGVGAPATNLQPVRGKLAADVVRIRVESVG